MPDRTTKAELAALERVFAAEINGLLPFQSKARIYRNLCDKGLLADMRRVTGRGPFAVTFSGYELTHAGRFLYCSSCDDGDGDDA
jgi:hypothetical protein